MKKYVVIFLKLKFKKKLLDCENLLLFGETLRAKEPNETRGKPSITRRSNYWKRERKKERKEKQKYSYKQHKRQIQKQERKLRKTSPLYEIEKKKQNTKRNR
jgi:hypothetical protein